MNLIKEKHYNKHFLTPKDKYHHLERFSKIAKRPNEAVLLPITNTQQSKVQLLPMLVAQLVTVALTLSVMNASHTNLPVQFSLKYR